VVCLSFFLGTLYYNEEVILMLRFIGSRILAPIFWWAQVRTPLWHTRLAEDDGPLYRMVQWANNL
jgi:hypothetical protein